MADYNSLAKSKVDPKYQGQRTALQNGLATALAAQDQSKVGINQNFVNQKADLTLQGNLNKNNVSNAALGRGLGKSSIVTSGLAGEDARTGRYINQADQVKTGQLDQVEQNKALLSSNLQNTLASLNGEEQNAISDMADQLQQRDYANSIQERQLKDSENNAAWQRNYQQQQLGFEQQKYNDSKSTAQQPTADDYEKNLYSQYLQVRDTNPTKAGELLKASRDDIIGNLGRSKYQSLIDEQNKYVTTKAANDKADYEKRMSDAWANTPWYTRWGRSIKDTFGF